MRGGEGVVGRWSMFWGNRCQEGFAVVVLYLIDDSLGGWGSVLKDEWRWVRENGLKLEGPIWSIPECANVRNSLFK